MLQVDMLADIRTVFGKGESRRLRMSQKTPAVVYGGGNDALSLQLDAGLLHKNLLEIQRRNAVITLTIAGDSKEKRHVLVKAVQKDPISDKPIHLDFLEIALDKAVEFMVPIKYTGTAKGVDFGGELHIHKRSVLLRGCPLDIPDTIDVDVTPLEKGGPGITCADLNVPQGVELLEKPTFVCAAVSTDVVKAAVVA